MCIKNTFKLSLHKIEQRAKIFLKSKDCKAHFLYCREKSSLAIVVQGMNCSILPSLNRALITGALPVGSLLLSYTVRMDIHVLYYRPQEF